MDPGPRRRRPGLVAGAGALLALALAGCASVRTTRFSVAELSGWATEDHAAALAAYQAGCVTARDAAGEAACARARAIGLAGEEQAKAFFEANFRPEPIRETGLLTGYFAPEYPARAEAGGDFSAPVRARPADTALLMAERTAIEAAPAPGALAWMRPEDLFFLQIQGSGVLVFPDGGRLAAVYAGDNGRPYVAIGRTLLRAGLIGPGQLFADTIHAWLAAHRGPEARAVMAQNARYVFFGLKPDDGRQPRGAAGLPLEPGRSVAIDPAYHAYGELLWLDAGAPALSGAAPAYRRLVVALDQGSAIKGEARADLYVGRGDQAGLEAGRVRHTLRLVRLIPIARPEERRSP